jgi:dihydroorotase
MQVELNSPLDMHLHLRQGPMLELVAPLSAQSFAGAVIMPNLIPPLTDMQALSKYRRAIEAATAGEVFEPYMTLFFQSYTEAELLAAREHIIGIKLYPEGITTNSSGGVRNLAEAATTLQLMEDMGIPLLVHGESHGFVMDREQEFLATYDELAHTYPRLRIVMEHITTRAAVEFLGRHEHVYATITLHHLMISLDDVAGGLLRPHLFCKPIAKRPEDRAALLGAALAGHPRVMFGSDSAPHPIDRKESAGCAAGVFTAPMALAMLAELFEQHDALAQLQTFVSDNARRIYGIEPPEKRVVLKKQQGIVPERYGDIVPFRAGEEIGWSISHPA